MYLIVIDCYQPINDQLIVMRLSSQIAIDCHRSPWITLLTIVCCELIDGNQWQSMAIKIHKSFGHRFPRSNQSIILLLSESYDRLLVIVIINDFIEKSRRSRKLSDSYDADFFSTNTRPVPVWQFAAVFCAVFPLQIQEMELESVMESTADKSFHGFPTNQLSGAL